MQVEVNMTCIPLCRNFSVQVLLPRLVWGPEIMRTHGRSSTARGMRLLVLATLIFLSQISWKMPFIQHLPAFCSSEPLLGQSTLPSRTRTWTSSSSKSYKTLLHQSAQSTDPPNDLILSPSEAERLQRAFAAKALEAIAVGHLAPGRELELIAALDLGTITWSQFPVPLEKGRLWIACCNALRTFAPVVTMP